jgi:hypothetical protein
MSKSLYVDDGGTTKHIYPSSVRLGDGLAYITDDGHITCTQINVAGAGPLEIEGITVPSGGGTFATTSDIIDSTAMISFNGSPIDPPPTVCATIRTSHIGDIVVTKTATGVYSVDFTGLGFTNPPYAIAQATGKGLEILTTATSTAITFRTVDFTAPGVGVDCAQGTLILHNSD